jgi:signal transduction histidine kinase
MLNLILNAVEAMSGIDEGARELQISTEMEATGGVLISVRDSGPGLAPTSVDRAFEAFYTTKPDGIGMGLAICRSIIETHGGRMWASANEPRGAVFQFTLPRDETAPAEHASQIGRPLMSSARTSAATTSQTAAMIPPNSERL